MVKKLVAVALIEVGQLSVESGSGRLLGDDDPWDKLPKAIHPVNRLPANCPTTAPYENNLHIRKSWIWGVD